MIELLTTLTVAGVLLAVAAPSFRTMTVNSRLTTQSTDVISAINFARSEAIKRNTTIWFCRAASEIAAKCDTGAEWQFWIVRTAAGTVIRRGVIPTYGNTLTVDSDLTNDQLAFSSDGLAHTGTSLISNQSFTVCAKNAHEQNRRTISLSAGSRISTKTVSEAC